MVTIHAASAAIQSWIRGAEVNTSPSENAAAGATPGRLVEDKVTLSADAIRSLKAEEPSLRDQILEKGLKQYGRDKWEENTRIRLRADILGDLNLTEEKLLQIAGQDEELHAKIEALIEAMIKERLEIEREKVRQDKLREEQAKQEQV